MNFIPEQNPQVRQLAKDAARKIKAIRDQSDEEIETIYRAFRTQADAIKKPNQR